jgi:hypothetical protein
MREIAVENFAGRNQIESTVVRSPKLRRALELLLEAVQYADETTDSRWEFAVEIEQLRQLELSDNDLRYLLRLRYLEHANEITCRTHKTRMYRQAGDLRFTPHSCFILTEPGVSIASRFTEDACGATPHFSRSLPIAPSYDQRDMTDIPVWDDRRRTLFLKGQVVKRFRWVAANQQLILSAFQEEGWPIRIDDPLAPASSLVGKQRLSDTIKCLNRKQENQLLRFRGDGSGQGVVWESRTEQTLRLASG